MIEQRGDSKNIWKAAAGQAEAFPLATLSLVALNIILFIGALPGDHADLANRYGLIPERLEFLRLFTTIFLHFDLTHLLVNVFFLWLFGRKVERVTGPVIFLLLYIGSGFMASLLHVLIALAFLPPELLSVPVVGASGAVAGVMGIYAVRFNQERIKIYKANIPSIYLILSWLVIQAGFGIAGMFTTHIGPIDVSRIGYWSHIGGFVFGMAAAWLTVLHDSRQSPEASLKELRRKTLFDIAEQFRALAGADPSDPFAYGELGRIRAHLGDQIGSTASYLDAVELYRKRGQQEEALACLQEALRFWPESALNPNTAFRFACSLESLGEVEEASGMLVRIAGAAHGSSEAEMALIKLAQIQLDRFNQPEKAAQTIELLKNDYPNSRWTDVADRILHRAKS
ncbi:MAG: rhomboid family intramembrane serine protease [Armatimonadota bacterium]